MLVNLAHDQKVVVSNIISSNILDESRVEAMPGRFLHPILIHSIKIRKIQVAKWGTPKIYTKTRKFVYHGFCIARRRCCCRQVVIGNGKREVRDD